MRSSFSEQSPARVDRVAAALFVSIAAALASFVASSAFRGAPHDPENVTMALGTAWMILALCGALLLVLALPTRRWAMRIAAVAASGVAVAAAVIGVQNVLTDSGLEMSLAALLDAGDRFRHMAPTSAVALVVVAAAVVSATLRRPLLRAAGLVLAVIVTGIAGATAISYAVGLPLLLATGTNPMSPWASIAITLLAFATALHLRVRKDGAVRDVHVRARTLTIRDRQYFSAAWHDITERKRADEQLRILSSAVEQNATSIVITDLAGNIQYVNPRFCEASGYTREEVLGRNPRVLKSGLTPQSVYVDLWDTISSGKVWRGEIVNRRRDGQIYIEMVVIAPVAGPDGTPSHYVGVKEDITERRRMEAALRASEERYRTIAENTRDMIWLGDLSAGTITYASPASMAIVGRPAKELVGLPMAEVLPAEFQDVVLDEFPTRVAALADGDQDARHRAREVHVSDAGGKGRWLEVVTTLVPDENGRPTQLLGVSRDITERVRAANELQLSHDLLEEERNSLARRVEERTADLSRVNAQLAQAARAKDEFLANMSHELRTPLNAILALSETLLEQIRGPLNERQQTSVRTIEASGRHLLSLITDILDLSKVEAGRMELQREDVAITEVCDASLAFVKETAAKKDLRLGLEIDDRLAVIDADPKRLKQMLVNFLSNAVKFTPAGGRVTLEVSTDAEAQTARFSVRDTGIGMTQEEMGRLFQPFVQLDSSLSRQHEGTGLGLALVRRLAELHGGRVGVESEVGKGSCFTITLPWTPKVTRAMTAPQLQVGGGAEVRVATIVDDSHSSADQLARYLAESHIHSHIYPHPVGVVEQIAESRPDVVFLDLLMPEASGWEVLAQLKSDPRTSDIPVVIVSVLDERPLALSRGAAEYLTKPISRDQVRRVLGTVAATTPKEQAAAAAIVESEERATAPSPRILLADDGEFNIIAIGDYLIDLRFEVTVARNGEEAVAFANETNPELILMDVQMPKMDGLEATRLLREQAAFARIPIIALTGLAMKGDRERCIAAGATDYLTKPVSPKALVETIRRYLAAREGGQA